MLVVDLQTQQAIELLTRGLSQFEKNKAISEGLRDAAKVFEAYARVNYVERLEGKYSTGQTLRSLRVRVNMGRRSEGGPMSLVGFNRDYGYKAHWIDLGTTDRYYETKRGKKKAVGQMPANHFFEDARVEGERPAMEAIYDGIQRAIDRINNGR